MVVKDLAKAQEALANAETLLRQSADPKAIVIAASVRFVQDLVAARLGELSG